MWNRDRSVLLSLVCTRVIIALALILAVAVAVVCLIGLDTYLAPGETLSVALTYYAFSLPALTALFTLDRLLSAIRRDEVFTQANVRSLRLISWCCFGAAAVLLLGCLFVRPLFPIFSDALIIVAILAAFFGTILRVIKNLFAAAVALKDENDFTI